MIKKLAIIPVIILALFMAQQAQAKIWTKDLVDKVDLNSGYKFQICTIDFNYDFNSVKDAGFLSADEKAFEANPDNYPCNKQSGQDVTLANITLNFTKAQGGGGAPEKLLLLQSGLYSVGQYGDILADSTSKDPLGDISPVDWFSTLPPGIRGIRAANLINTDPSVSSDQATLQNSGFLILHDPTTGKFTSALFVLNNTVYKVSNIVSQVTQPTTLVDYTNSEPTSTAAAPTPTAKLEAANPTPIPNPNLSTYTNSLYGYSFQYPKYFVFNNSSTRDNVSFLQKQEDLMAQRLLVMANQDPSNISLMSYAQKSGYDTAEAKPMTISGHEALLINKTFSLKDECGTGDTNQITRTKNLLVRAPGSIIDFITDDSCETFQTDWFSQILPTVYFSH